MEASQDPAPKNSKRQIGLALIGNSSSCQKHQAPPRISNWPTLRPQNVAVPKNSSTETPNIVAKVFSDNFVQHETKKQNIGDTY